MSSGADGQTPGTDAGGHDGGPDAAERRDGGLLRGLYVFVKEVVIVVVLAVVLSLIAKTWLVQSFYIPSASMNNTLVKDDRVVVSKLTPTPFALERGDIVVFEDPGGWLDPTVKVAQTPLAEGINNALTWVGLLPEDEGNHLIKRAIGLPGDRVACCSADGRITVNGVAITEPYVHPGDRPSELTFDVVVPPNRIWVMGDHRSDSRDSRWQDGDGGLALAGSVPLDHVVGRAFAVVLPLRHLAWLGNPSATFEGVPAAPGAPSASSAARTPTPTGPPTP